MNMDQNVNTSQADSAHLWATTIGLEEYEKKRGFVYGFDEGNKPFIAEIDYCRSIFRKKATFHFFVLNYYGESHRYEKGILYGHYVSERYSQIFNCKHVKPTIEEAIDDLKIMIKREIDDIKASERRVISQIKI